MYPNNRMAARVVRDRRQGLGQFRFGRGEGRQWISGKKFYGLAHVGARRSNERVRRLFSGSAASARSKKLRACATLSGVGPLLNQAKP